MESVVKRSGLRWHWWIAGTLVAMLWQVLTTGVFGDEFWLIGLTWFVVNLALAYGPRIGIPACSILALILVAHAFGYKVYGKPERYTNRPFEPDGVLTEIRKDGGLILADGRVLFLDGLVIAGTADPMTGMPGVSKQMLKYVFQDCWNQADGIPIAIGNGAAGHARVDLPTGRSIAGCGLTFAARPFPPRWKRYGRMDLGEWLVQRGYANPDGTSADADYGKRLTALARSRSEAEERRRQGAGPSTP